MSGERTRNCASLVSVAVALVAAAPLCGEPPKGGMGAAGEVLETDSPLLRTVRLRGAGVSAAFLPDGKTLLSAGGTGKGIRAWDPGGGKAPAEWPADPGGCLAVAAPPSAAAPPVVVSATANGFTIWDAKERAAVGRIPVRGGAGYGLQVSADGRVLIADPYGSRLYDLRTGKEIRVAPEGVTGRVIAVAPDCKTLLSVDIVSIRLWEGGRDKVAAQQVADDVPPERLVLGGAARGLLLHEFPLSGPVIRRAAFSADGRTLLILDGDTKLVVWDVKGGQVVRRWDRTGANVFVSIAISPDGRRVAAVDRVGQGAVWDVVSGGPLLTFAAKTYAHAPPTFSPDGRMLAVSETDGSVVVFHAPPRPAAGALSAKELDELWELMAARGDQEAAANRALFALADVPKQALPLIKERLRPPPPAEPARVKELIADLNSDEAERRDAAFEALHKMGVAAAGALQEALKRPPSDAVRARLKVLVGAADSSGSGRAARAVRALEAIDSDESRRALAGLAKQKGDPWLAAAADAALDRLLLPRAGGK